MTEEVGGGTVAVNTCFILFKAHFHLTTGDQFTSDIFKMFPLGRLKLILEH